jgi:hypothetical protein
MAVMMRQVDIGGILLLTVMLCVLTLWVTMFVFTYTGTIVAEADNLYKETVIHNYYRQRAIGKHRAWPKAPCGGIMYIEPGVYLVDLARGGV